MQEARFFLDSSPWFVLLSLVIGATYSFVLYQKKGPWSKRILWALATFRFITISTLCFLLLGPLIRLIQNELEEPTWVVAIDNSTSILATTDSVALSQVVQSIQDLANDLKDDFRVEIRSLSGLQEAEASAISFDQGASPLYNMLEDIKADYEGQNLAGVLLATDGIFNQGASPAFQSYGFPIFSLGMGDTIPKEDAILQAVYFNQIAYQGNQFPVVAEIKNDGLLGKSSKVQIWQAGNLISEQPIVFSEQKQVQEIRFLLNAEEEGVQRYQVRLGNLDGEFTQENNSQNIYLDVIEGREKILLAASAPHPDIKAIRSAIEKNANYEVTTFIPGLSEWQEDKYDVIILHQFPSMRQNLPPALERMINEGNSVWHIWGPLTNLNAFNSLNSVLTIRSQGNQTDRVTPAYNHNFSRFNISDKVQGIAQGYLPSLVPYGTLELKGAPDVLFRQKVGNIPTDKALWAFTSDESDKQAITLVSGLWQWRLQEYAQTGEQNAFDELVSKTVQFLSTKEDRRKFKVFPLAAEYIENQPIILETEAYNAIYEEVYGQSIALTITNGKGVTQDFNYTTSASNTQYRINNLPEGIYSFTATTMIDGETVSSMGSFTVKDLQLETLELTANHQVLRSISDQSGGNFGTSIQSLESPIKQVPTQSLIHSQERYMPIVDLPWVFFIILLLITVEWVLRRYHGSY